MGKRKERRLAAMMAAGRRVKLDLFVEPTGELVEASINDEAGGGFDQNDHPGACKSPSSSGKPPANPLLLLGQYSDDDELDEVEDDKLQDAATENRQTGKMMEPSDSEDEDTAESNSAKSITLCGETEGVICKFDPLQSVDNVDDNDTPKVEFATMLDSLGGPNGMVEASDLRNVGDSAIVWTTVMHEQSGHYYYWNVVTGETSWERPNSCISEVLPVGCEGSTSAIGDGEGAFSASSGFHAPNGELSTHADAPVTATTLNDVSDTFQDKRSDDMTEVKTSKTDGKSDGMEDLFLDVKGTQKLSDDLASATKVLVQDAPVDNALVSDLDNGGSIAGSKIIQDEECERKLVESDQLIESCNSLLQRLNELDRLDDTIEGHNRRSKYSLEVEVRLSDCKALSPFGSSLLPFWLHIEACLERIAVTINEEEASLLVSKHVKTAASQPSASGRCDETLQQNLTITPDPKHEDEHLDASVTVVYNTIEQPSVFGDDIEHNSPSNSPGKAAIDCVLEGELQPGLVDDHVVLSVDSEIGRIDGQEVSERYSGSTYNTVENSHHDVDMDVDMEVDEDATNQNAVLRITSSVNCFVPGEHQTLANSQSSYEPLPPIPDPVGEPCPPPPSEEDWIPPPPPDNDLVPPPPPDDPPVPQYTSSSLYVHHENIHPLPYTQHYSFTYTIPGVDYYGGTTTEVSDASYYSHGVGVGCHLEAQILGYEEMVNPVPEAASVITNPVEPIVYYEALNATPSSVPVTAAVQSSGYQEIPGTISYHENAGADHVGPVMIAFEDTSSSLQSSEVERDVSPFSRTHEASKPVTFSSAMLPIATTPALGENSVIASATAGVATGVAVAAKNPSKVTRCKKKTIAAAPTLRSNRKVSSLVDKWKAAKEELHAEEKDEPENAYEILERKRQREIEEWHAKQIASGEALDNANFQPLGGDWKERVKRKRAGQKTSESESLLDQPPLEKQQSDVTQLSENLPSGWQAYWDESSGQVYYGNSSTMETTWTRPVS